MFDNRNNTIATIDPRILTIAATSNSTGPATDRIDTEEQIIDPSANTERITGVRNDVNPRSLSTNAAITNEMNSNTESGQFLGIPKKNARSQSTRLDKRGR